MHLSDEIILRDWRPSDAPVLASHLNNMNVLKELPRHLPFPYTQRHARVFIGMTNCCDTRLEKAIEHSGMLVGAFSVIPQEDIWHRNAELRFFLGEPHWGKGIMTHALKKMVHYIFENFDFERVYSYVFEHNRAGIGVLKKNGFIQEGILRKAALVDKTLYNICLFSILKE